MNLNIDREAGHQEQRSSRQKLRIVVKYVLKGDETKPSSESHGPKA